ncbi:hypothetical protein HPB52_004502 [Rhipicephalus sanguineus]|uniref:Uncharacterized protein n=1 Tax=Rhipicephalus sanguineus TaxID=34632 RepID=A0A9D4T3U0_RHISA|nr:hypothetical protein HPB52_004502 [Rhipicephalus sanguineus]
MKDLGGRAGAPEKQEMECQKKQSCPRAILAPADTHGHEPLALNGSFMFLGISPFGMMDDCLHEGRPPGEPLRADALHTSSCLNYDQCPRFRPDRIDFSRFASGKCRPYGPSSFLSARRSHAHLRPYFRVATAHLDMEYRVDGTDIDATELENGEWKTIPSLRNKHRPATADNSPQQSAGLIGQAECSGTDRRRTTEETQDGMPTPSHSLKGDVKVVVRPRGLDVTKQTPRTLLTALSSATEVSLQEALAQDQLRLHPINNTFTISTPVEARARSYAHLTSIPLGASGTDVTAYLAPPDDAVRYPLLGGHPHVFLIGQKWKRAITVAASGTAKTFVRPQQAETVTIAVTSKPQRSLEPAHRSASSAGAGTTPGTPPATHDPTNDRTPAKVPGEGTASLSEDIALRFPPRPEDSKPQQRWRAQGPAGGGKPPYSPDAALTSPFHHFSSSFTTYRSNAC